MDHSKRDGGIIQIERYKPLKNGMHTRKWTRTLGQENRDVGSITVSYWWNFVVQ